MSAIVKTFFHVFTKSLIPHSRYYKKLIRTPLSFSLKYFVALILVVNIFFVVLWIIKASPQKLITLRNSLIKSLDDYPDDLKVFIKNGFMVTSLNRPSFFWLDYEDRKNLALVIDEYAVPSDIDKYNAYFLLTNSALVVNQKKIPTRHGIIPVGNMNISIDKNNVNNVSHVIRNSSLFLLGILLFVLLAIPVVSLIFKLLAILVISILSYVLFIICHNKHSFSKVFQISLHSSTLPVIVVYGIHLVNPNSANLSIPFMLLALIFALSGLYEAYLDS